MPALRAMTKIHCIIVLYHWVYRAFACEGSQVNCFLLTLCLSGESEMHTLISCFTRYLASKILLQQKPVPPQMAAKCYLLHYVTLIFQCSTIVTFGLYVPTQSVHCSVFKMTGHSHLMKWWCFSWNSCPDGGKYDIWAYSRDPQLTQMRWVSLMLC